MVNALAVKCLFICLPTVIVVVVVVTLLIRKVTISTVTHIRHCLCKPLFSDEVLKYSISIRPVIFIAYKHNIDNF